jgi:hypothetical protein
MRWFNLFIIFVYLSILLSPPAKAVTQNRVDVIGSGLSVKNVIMPLAQHLPGQSVVHSDTPDDSAVFNSVVVSVSFQSITLLPVALPAPPSSARLLAQPRAPPSLS